jgi:hypothetical protein
MTTPLRQTKINKILSFYPHSTIIIDKLNKVIINDIEYIEKNTIYKITTLNKIEIKNILNNTSSLRNCLDNKELRTLRIENFKRDYILYSLQDILKINEFKTSKKLIELPITTGVVQNTQNLY